MLPYILRARSRLQPLSYNTAVYRSFQAATSTVPLVTGYKSPMVLTRKRAAESSKANESLQAVVERLSLSRQCQYPPVSNKHAAVLIPVFEDHEGVVRVLLTQRSSNLNSHRGEVCLPGGKRDPTDPDDSHTALREAEEELGLHPSVPRVICTLPPHLSKHFLSVTPVIAVIPRDFVPVPNPSEVAAVFDMPLHLFLEESHHSHKDFAWDGISYRVHYFEYESYTVWGLTAAILIRAAQLALGKAPEFVEHSSRGAPYTKLYYNGEKVCVLNETSSPELEEVVAAEAARCSPQHDQEQGCSSCL